MSNSTQTSTGVNVNVQAHTGIVAAIKESMKAIAGANRKSNRLYIDIAHYVINDKVTTPQLVASFIEAGYKETSARTTSSRIFLLTRPTNKEVLEKVEAGKMTMRAALSKMQSENPRENKSIQDILIGRFENTVLNLVFKDGLDKPKCTELQFQSWAQKAYRNVVASLEQKDADKAAKLAAKHEKVNVTLSETRKSGKTETHRTETKAA
jgi:hypothetical protein